jgi:beta-galactosidase
MYKVLANVQTGSTVVDNETTPFGIRTIKFDPDAGFSLNGVSMKLKGVCIHHDVSGLGAAVPMRAWERRFEQLKSIGVNAIRTSHNFVAPEFLDLCDQMGLMVMDEFFDAWVAHKESGDFGGTTFNTWGLTDATDTVKRDRNHPSIVLYSIGNEIRDSLSTRLPIAKNLVSICHTYDPGRPVTQGLFRPNEAGDYPGAMVDVLDVFGVNYRSAELLAAIEATPHHSGVLTEMGVSTANWSTVTSNQNITGLFFWTGVDYLGESGTWPTIGSGAGMLDRVGTPKDIGYTFVGLWGGTASRPKTGSSATKITLTADQTTFKTDLNDVVYVQAAITDGSGGLITSASNTVSFSISGPGKIIAVDSGISTTESFRGNQRNAYQGICFAIVQATGAGSITVTASASGLTGSSVTMQAVDGTFVP